jgi:hypothetical protein
MAYGFQTTKTAQGFVWGVTRTEWNEELGRAVTTLLKSGLAPTRAKATGIAKRWTLFFRRGGAL